MNDIMTPDMANHPNRSKRTSPGPTREEVRQAREAAGLTQAEAGELVHCSWQTWQNWELEGDEGRRMHPATWDLFNIKVRARLQLEAGKISPAQLRALGVTLPPAPAQDK